MGWHSTAHDRGGRRRIAALAAGLAVAALAAGCSSSGGADRPGGSPGAANGTGAGSTDPGAFPVHLDQPLGGLTVPSRPARIVTLGSAETDIAVALGVMPVGVAATPLDASGLTPWLGTALASASGTASGTDPKPQLLDISNGAPIEKVAALHPDLIIATSLSSIDRDYARLSRLAPVLSYATGLFADSWQQQTTRIGQALGEPDKVAALIAGVDARIADTVKRHPEFAGATVTAGIVSDSSSINVVQSEKDFTGRLFAELGLTIPEAVQAMPPAAIPGITTVSLERLESIDADVLLVSYLGADARHSFETNPVFTALPAVRAGHYHVMDLATGTALRVPSPLSIPYALDHLVPEIADALR